MKKLLALVLAVAMMIIPMTALADSNFIEPTYYPDYDEDVDYLPPAEDEEEEEAPEETQDLYMVTCRTLNVRAGAGTNFETSARCPAARRSRSSTCSPAGTRSNTSAASATSPPRTSAEPPADGRPGPGSGAARLSSPALHFFFPKSSGGSAPGGMGFPAGVQKLFFSEICARPGNPLPLRGALFPPPAEKNGAAARVSAPAGGMGTDLHFFSRYAIII